MPEEPASEEPAIVTFAGSPIGLIEHTDIWVIFTRIQTDSLSVWAEMLFISFALAYLVGCHRLRRRGAHWSLGRTAAFLAGVVVALVAVGSGLAAYDDTSFPAHILQHLLLMMVAPPLLVLGRPVTLAVQASGRPMQARIVRAVRHPVARWIAGPASAVVYLAMMWVYFLTPVYGFSLHHPLLHAASHVYGLVIGYVYWQCVIGLDPSPSRPGYGVRIVGILVGMVGEAALGAALLLRSTPLLPRYTLAQTHAGGQLFWLGAMVTSGVGLSLLIYQWALQDERRAARLDANAPTPVGLSPSP